MDTDVWPTSLLSFRPKSSHVHSIYRTKPMNIKGTDVALHGKVALVTGASRGIGRATAERLARAGAQLVVTARTEAALSTTVDAIRNGDGKAIAIACDVGDFKQVEAAVVRAKDTFGQLDIVVNNAGTIDPIVHLANSNPDDWSRAVQTNLLGVYHTIRAAMPVMIAQQSGTIINMSSGAANSALEGWSAYCTTKAATKMLTQCAHKELVGKGIRVVGLSPGTVATDMMMRIKESEMNPVSQLDWSTHIPPSWAAEAVLYLCGSGGDAHLGMDFSIKTDEGRRAVGLPLKVE